MTDPKLPPELREVLLKLATGLPNQVLGEVGIRREGDQIIIPAHMTIDEAILWLKRKKESEGKVVAINWSVPCMPFDGVIALYKALKKIYGFTDLRGNDSWFGERPPEIIQIPTGPTTFEAAVLGKIQPPTFEGGHLQAHVTQEPILHVRGEVKMKFQADMDRIQKETLKILKTESIYKGKAIILDLSYLSDDGPDFNPVQHAPTFMDLSSVKDNSLILNPHTEFELTSNIFTLIESTESCQSNNIPLKHGLLLYGPYGTGKTMTARVTAAKAERNGWSFIYLKQTQFVAHALKLAELYAPAVIFAEDIDQVTKGERDEGLNEILNTLDGIDTKDKPIITILTTNNQGDIHPGFLRAGRIDTAVFMGPPEPETAARFVTLYAGRLLANDVDFESVGNAFAGFVPAFIAEAVQKAKRAVIHREKTGNIDGKVTTNDLLLSAKALQTHRDMVNNQRVKTTEEEIYTALGKLAKAFFLEANQSDSDGSKQPSHRQIHNLAKEINNKV